MQKMIIYKIHQQCSTDLSYVQLILNSEHNVKNIPCFEGKHGIKKSAGCRDLAWNLDIFTRILYSCWKNFTKYRIVSMFPFLIASYEIWRKYLLVSCRGNWKKKYCWFSRDRTLYLKQDLKDKKIPSVMCRCRWTQNLCHTYSLPLKNKKAEILALQVFWANFMLPYSEFEIRDV
jgi:hypothetical protein